MKRITIFLIVIMLPMFLSAGSFLVSTGDSVNIRETPSLNAKVIGQLNKGDRVEFLDRSPVENSDTWTHDDYIRKYWIQIKTSSNIDGWVYCDYLTSVFDDINDLSDIPSEIKYNAVSKGFKSEKELLNATPESRYRYDKYTFSGNEMQYLRKYGFFMKDYRYGSNLISDEMADFYQRYSYVKKTEAIIKGGADDYYDHNVTPYYITADYLLHIYHLVFMRMLENLEEKKFYGLLKNFTGDIEINAIKGFETSSDDEIRKAYKTVAMYFAVPALIFDINITNKEIRTEAKKIISDIDIASGFEKLEFLDTKEDFSQYKPRGHYEKNEILQKYFKAMMWYGRVKVPNSQTLEQAVLISLLKKKEISDKLQKIRRPVTLLVGKTDGASIDNYEKAYDSVFGSNYAFSSVDKAKLDKFGKAVSVFPLPLIISTTVRDDNKKLLSEDKVKNQISGLSVFGQSFIFDSYIFTLLTSPRTGTDIEPRNDPKGLDVMALLGSKEAYEELDSDRRLKKNYVSNYNKLKDFYSKNYNYNSLDQSVYDMWLQALSALFDKRSEKLPKFTKTQEWNYRLLLSAHGSWAELRHDTLLYSHQSYSESGAPYDDTVTYFAGRPYVPKGYVEPNPRFLSIMREMVQKTKNELSKADSLTLEYENKLGQLDDILSKLIPIAEKEISGAVITEDEFLVIARSFTSIDAIILPKDRERILSQDDLKMAIISDVHTNCWEKRVLEAAVGTPRKIFVHVKDRNGNRVCVGHVFSYYEFYQPQSDRYTDSEWKKYVYDKNNKEELKTKEPSWIKRIPYSE